MEQVVLGGVNLGNYCTAVPVSRGVPVASSDLEHVIGSDCYIAKGTDLLPTPISVKLIADGSVAERRELLREVAPLLLSKEPVSLAFSNDNGRYHIVVPGGDADLESFATTGSMVVAFQPLHAAMYGAERSVTVPSGGSVAFNVGGTYPTRPRIAASAVRDPSSLVWGVRLDGGDFVHVATGSASARKVELDCAERTCRIAGAIALPTLDSDWLALKPGMHTLSMDNGTGAATVTYRERWL